ncbi:MAG: polysaccharide biosynthesis tyrosine autokinase [Planctomycetes bacterium]|nr:polysaccharide biosynthesis tyrosine autokinase [Planctomycetota bacterium]
MSTDTANDTPRQIEFSAPESQESGWAFLGFAWRRKWLIAFAIVVALALGYLHFLKQPAMYQSSAQMLIVKQRGSVPISGVTLQTSYDSSHETLLRSPVIISKAVEKHDLGSLPSMRGSGDPTPRVIAGLGVSGTVSDTGDIVDFTFSSGSREDCPKVLEAVIAAYRDFLGETYENVNEETIELIGQAKDVLDRQISEAQREYQKFREDAPLLYLGGEGQNVHESRLSQIEGMRSGLVVEEWGTQAKIEAIEAALKRGGDREALNLMIGHIREAAGAAEGGSGASVDDQMWPMLMEEQLLLDDYGPDHPKIKSLRRRMKLTREHLLGKSPSTEDGEQEPRDYYDIYVDSLREQITFNKEQLAALDRLFDKETEEAKKIDKSQVEDSNYRGSIERKERMFDAVIARLEEINVSKDLGNIKTQVIHPPSGARQTAPDMKKSMTTAGILGLLAGLALAFVVDSLDRRFRSPDDIRNDLGLPVVGHIPVIPVPNKEGHTKEEQEAPDGTPDPVLRTIHHPRGSIAEAYRAVRTALYFNTRGGGHKVIQVTSPNPGDGKTTLAANVAVSIANSGKQVLLLDADFRRPRQHKLFGMDDSVGLSEVIAGTVEVADAVRQTQVEGLSIMVCGPRPNNPAELLTSARFQELLEVLREKYEFVIIDTPPVLAVTDPLAVAPRVDGVLLVIRLAKSARAATRRALEALDSLGANILGVVVNGVGGGSRYGGYGYSSYKYGRGYGGYGYRYGGYGGRYGYGGYGYRYGGYGGRYGYGYGYGDGDKTKDKSYYTEDDGKTRAKPTQETEEPRGQPGNTT